MDEYIADYTYKESVSCLSETSSISCAIDRKRIVVVAYEKIRIWNVETLSVERTVNYTAENGLKSKITAICGVEEGGETLLMVGHENGVVRCIDTNGEERSGYREHMRRVFQIVSYGGLCVSCTTGGFTAYDMRTESVLLTVHLDLVISSVRVLEDVLLVCTEKGIVHKYKVEDVFNRVADSEVVASIDQPILDSFAKDGAVYVVHPECVVNLETGRRVDVRHRISHVRTGNGHILTKDTKNRCRVFRIDGTAVVEERIFRAKRPLCAMELAGSSAVLVFADNGISVYSEKEKRKTKAGAETEAEPEMEMEERAVVEGGADNLVGICAGGGVVFGITEKEGKVFGRVETKEKMDMKEIAISVFEDEGMCCMATDGEVFYVGKEDGTVVVRNKAGAEVRRLKAGPERVASLDVLGKQMMAVGSGAKVGILMQSGERDEIGYEDEVVCTKFSKDGGLILTSLADNTVKVHKIDGEHVLTLFGHSVPVVDIEVCMEREAVYTLGGDKLVKIWGLRHGECRRTLNPGEPTGIRLHENLLIVSTADGLVYYHKDTLRKIKRVVYGAGKRRGTAGQNRIAIAGYNLFAIRERSVAHFEEGEYGTTPEQQEALEREEREIEEISKEKKVLRIDEIGRLEKAIEENSAGGAKEALERLTHGDVKEAVGMMNNEAKEKFWRLLVAISKEPHSALTFSWALGSLVRSEFRAEGMEGLVEEARKKIRAASRRSLANRTALIWNCEEQEAMEGVE